MHTFRYIQSTELKFFTAIVLGTLFLLHVLAYIIYSLHIPFTVNDHLFTIQMSKIQLVPGSVDTIIVGDSSAGNAIDATRFSELSGGQTLNLALSRLHGFEGSLNMVKQARLHHPEIKNVIFVQSFDMWGLSFSREGFFKTEKGIRTDEIGSHFFSTYKWLDRFAYETDLRWIYRLGKYALHGNPRFAFENDYIKNPGEMMTFRNGGHTPPEKNKVPTEPLGQNQTDMYTLFDVYCKKELLNCIFVGGPLHEDVVHNLDATYFTQIFNFVDRFSSIQAVHTVFSIPNENMGDAINHVDITYKPTMTKRYYEVMKDMLQ